MSPLVSGFFRRAAEARRRAIQSRLRARPSLQLLEGRIAPATFTVTNANDAGPGSLRQAILDTNATPNADTIAFDPTFFATPRTINLTSELLISDNLAINGPGSSLLTIRPAVGVASRILEVNGTNVVTGTSALNVSMSGMTLTGGNDNGGGAVLAGDDNLTLDGCVITGNTAQTSSGGGIQVGPGFLSLLNSTVSENTAGLGGGISVRGTAGLLVLNSTISSNAASGAGGGIVFSDAIGSSGFAIRNSTISGNTAGGGGGGLYISSLTLFPPGTASVQSSTITNNVANSTTVGGGGIGEEMPNPLIVGPAAFYPPTIAVQSTIVSGNSNPLAPDIGGSFFNYGETPTVDASFSAIGSPKGFSLATKSANNLPYGTDLRLGPLAYNGGTTQTHALLPGSPAIDKGDNPAGLRYDQRGAGFPRVVGPAADIGAYEVSPLIVTSVAVNAGLANQVQRSMVTSVTVTFASRVTFTGSPVDAFQLARTGRDGPLGNVTLSVDLSGSTATQTIARLTFSGPLTEGFAGAPSLIDGNYTLTVFSSQVNGGVVVGDQTATLFRLFGDMNGDRAVNGLDLTSFRSAFGTMIGQPGYVEWLDINGDGAIDGTDLVAFRKRFGVILP
jgi:hypothetical protein